MYIDNTLLTFLIVLSLGIIVGGLGLVWRLAAPVEPSTIVEEYSKGKKKKEKSAKVCILLLFLTVGCEQEGFFKQTEEKKAGSRI